MLCGLRYCTTDERPRFCHRCGFGAESWRAKLEWLKADVQRMRDVGAPATVGYEGWDDARYESAAVDLALKAHVAHLAKVHLRPGLNRSGTRFPGRVEYDRDPVRIVE